MRPRVSGGLISNELADHIAVELGPLGLVPDATAFERLFVEVVLAAHPDSAQAWTAFYGNTMRRLRRPDRGGTDSIATFARIYRHVLSLIQGTTVLDVGCCFGFLPLLIAERSPWLRVVGADLAPAAAMLAGRMAREQGSRARFAAADLLALPVADEAVDTVLAVHVLEHLPAGATATALAQLCRVARCRVVVAVPLEDVPDPTFGHVQAFDLRTLAGIAGSAGVRGWSRAVYPADGGWLVLDRCERRLRFLPDRAGSGCPKLRFWPAMCPVRGPAYSPARYHALMSRLSQRDDVIALSPSGQRGRDEGRRTSQAISHQGVPSIPAGHARARRMGTPRP